MKARGLIEFEVKAMGDKADLSKMQFVSELISSNIPLRLMLWLAVWVAAISLSRWISETLTIEVFQVYFPLKCPIKWILGITCPTCGLGRSIILFLAGQIRLSFDAHFLGPIVVVSCASTSLVWSSWPSMWLKVPRFMGSFRRWFRN
jgi:hypothetical protein